MSEFDPGPPSTYANLFSTAPSYASFKDHFWFDWGPVFYRGRLDGSARLLCIASDPGPTERIACRTLVGDAGQRVQGFLTKLGLTRSYLCLNAFIYAMYPSHSSSVPAVLEDPAQRAWRNQLFDRAKTDKVEAIVAFGRNAQQAIDLWPGASTLPVLRVPHPSSHDAQALVDAWRAAITELRSIVSPDPDGSTSGPNYGAAFAETDYAPIPKVDIPFGLPDWFGDDHWGRTGSPRHSDCVSRPSPDDHHHLLWVAPDTEGTP
jgi:Uracil DNA glycosylase superfamily